MKSRNAPAGPVTELNEQHNAFCRDIANGVNQQQAAINAGYSEKTAAVKGSQLMSMPLIRAEVQRLKGEVSKRWMIDQDYIVTEYMELINYAKQINPKSGRVMDGNVWIKGVQALSKTLGLDAADKVDVTSAGQPININYIKPKKDE